MDGLDKTYEENIQNHRYEVIQVDLNPPEKNGNPKVYGAIWFDREAGKNDVLREPGLDGEMIVIINDGLPGNGGFRFLFSLVGASNVEWVVDIKTGALFALVGNIIGGATDEAGKIEFAPVGSLPGASLGFFSEFGMDENGNLIKL